MAEKIREAAELLKDFPGFSERDAEWQQDAINILAELL